MRRLITILTFTGLIYSCSNNNNSTIETTTSKDSLGNIDLFLNIFKEIDTKDLHIYTPPYDTSNRIDKFHGKQIDRKYYNYLIFGNHINPNDLDTFYHYFACYKFKLSDNKTGLIIRRPSQYSETAIDLYTWDNQAKKVTNIINLADAFGDEGWYFVQDAWVIDLNNDKLLDIVTRRKDYDQDLDDTTKAPIMEDSLFVYIAKGDLFIKTIKQVDTNSYKILDWKED